MDESPELRLLFHRLNNQLGIILAHAELLEAKAPDDSNRARAAQVVTSALEAMGTANRSRQRIVVRNHQKSNSAVKMLAIQPALSSTE
jgi:hypothetical protein